MSGRLKRWQAAAVVGFALASAAGCRERHSETKVMTLEGVVEKIQLRDGVVWVRFYSEKYKMERTERVHVTPESEIMINGVLADLSDVKVGERASGNIRVEKRGAETIFTALRVEIRRSEPVKSSSSVAEPGGGLMDD